MSSQNFSFFPDNNEPQNGQHTQNPATYQNSGDENQPPANTPRQPFQFGSLPRPDLTGTPQGYFPPPGLPPLRQQGFYSNVPRQPLGHHPSSPFATFNDPPTRPQRVLEEELPPVSSASLRSLPPPKRQHVADSDGDEPPPPNPKKAKKKAMPGSDVDEASQPPAKRGRKKAMPKPIKPATPADKADKEEPASKKGRGRTKEATACTNAEMRQLTDLTNGFPERQVRPLQMKWNGMIRIATEHPTGDALGDLQDDSDIDEDVINISSGEDEEPVVKAEQSVKKEKGRAREKLDAEKGTAVTKAFRTEPPLPSRDSTSRTSRAQQATAALQSIAAAAGPEHQQHLQDQRTQRTLQIIQFQHLQTQVSTLTQQLEDTRNRLHQEQMRTVASQNELRTLQLMLSFPGQGRGFDFDTSRSHYTPRCHGYKRRRYSRYDPSPSPEFCSRSRRRRDERSWSPIRSPVRSPIRSLSIQPTSRSPLPPAGASIPSSPLHAPGPSTVLEEVTPSVASGSRVTLDMLADVADHLETGHNYSIRPQPNGDLEVEVSPSRKPFKY
ncbi:hypothetical protein PQX77_010648 [Marasmius sp. AFHP31]|nr:hypothetical protein PQX77_010648 [Marasmius sp. AFHP31]